MNPFEEYFDLSEKDVYTVEKSDKDLYVIVEFLGEGASGRVYKAISCSTGKLVAIKYLIKADEQEFKDEYDMLFELSSVCRDNAVCLLDGYSHLDKDGERYYRIVMEYIKGAYDLKKYMKEIPLESSDLLGRIERNDVAVQLVLALDTLHKNGFSHQDIKELNIMWDFSKNIPKFADFGGSCSLKKDCNGNPNHLCKGHCGFLGTDYTLPPEMRESDRIFNLIKASQVAMRELKGKIKWQNRRKRELTSAIDNLKIRRKAAQENLRKTGARTREQTSTIQEIGAIDMDIEKTKKKLSQAEQKKEYFQNGLNTALHAYQTYYPQLSLAFQVPGTFISTKAHDMWSLGVVLYDWYVASDLECDIGHYPSFDPVMNSLSQGDINKKIGEIRNPFAREILKLLLEKSPATRTRNWEKVVQLVKNHTLIDFRTDKYLNTFASLMDDSLNPDEEDALNTCMQLQRGTMKNIMGESVSTILKIAAENKLDLNMTIKDLITAFSKI